tara:strand:- start:447 stop:575 length:129 start_codon:yes stop_codon:yes gene_type:complete
MRQNADSFDAIIKDLDGHCSHIMYVFANSVDALEKQQFNAST